MTSTQASREPHVTTSAERALAVEHWLLSAAETPGRARADWEESGRALLRCGGVFAAVRLSARLVCAAAPLLIPISGGLPWKFKQGPAR